MTTQDTVAARKDAMEGTMDTYLKVAIEKFIAYSGAATDPYVDVAKAKFHK